MKRHDVTLTERERVAEATMAFHFERPADFVFKAGQAINLVVPGVPAAEARHAFSLVSAPFENEIVVATRTRDSVYKRALAALAVGATARIEGPFGALTLHEDRERPAVLVAGGIGITPFVSMVRQATKEESPQRLALVYSSRRPEDAAFLGVLQQLERRNDRFRLLATMTEMTKSSRPWDGETRTIDPHLLGIAGAGLAAPAYYVVGPPPMVEAMEDLLDRAGVAGEDIRSETFYGYGAPASRAPARTVASASAPRHATMAAALSTSRMRSSASPANTCGVAVAVAPAGAEGGSGNGCAPSASDASSADPSTRTDGRRQL